MDTLSLNLRLRHLLLQQNKDGGWGHYPGQGSWLEPTIYAIFALWEQHQKAAERGLEAVRRWQHREGGFRVAAEIDDVCWGTALALMAHQSAGLKDETYRRGLDWLLRTQGKEGGTVNSVLKRFIRMPAEQNEELHGWPWRPGTSSWVEPTAYALIAIKRAGELARVKMAEEMILDRRCEDGGWNYGNRRIYDIPVPSYPETTALALLGLQGRAEVAPSLQRAKQFWREKPLGIARAWVAIALEVHGNFEGTLTLENQLPLGGAVALTALEALALQPGVLKMHFGAGGHG